jgi:S1-C subfamily serine protease
MKMWVKILGFLLLLPTGKGVTGAIPATGIFPQSSSPSTPKNDPDCSYVRDQSVVTVFVDKGLGSGSVVHPSGLILTNDHVVAEARNGQVQVKFYDGRKYRGKVVSDDPRMDQALIQIDNPNQEQFPAVQFPSPPSTPPQGTPVVAIGSPKGKEGVITKGDIGRSVRQGDTMHSAFLNHGNSGGPLLKQGTCEFVSLNKGILPQAPEPYQFTSTAVEAVYPFIQKYLSNGRVPP